MHFARAGTGPSRTAIPGTSPAQAPVPRPRDRSAGRNRRRHQSLTSQERLAQPQPDGSASPTAEHQRYSASTRPQGKRNQLQPLDGCPELRSGLLAGCQSGFDSGRSFVAARLNQLRPDHPTPAFPSSASPTAERQRYSASTRPQDKRTPPPVRGHTQRQPSRHPPAFPSSASPTAERQRYSASERPQGKRNQPRGPRFRLGPLVPRGPAQPALEGATPPVISALTRSIPWKTAIKIKGLSAFRTFP